MFVYGLRTYECCPTLPDMQIRQKDFLVLLIVSRDLNTLNRIRSAIQRHTSPSILPFIKSSLANVIRSLNVLAHETVIHDHTDIPTGSGPDTPNPLLGNLMLFFIPSDLGSDTCCPHDSLGRRSRGLIYVS
jgi:hypothetical protein